MFLRVSLHIASQQKDRYCNRCRLCFAEARAYPLVDKKFLVNFKNQIFLKPQISQRPKGPVISNVGYRDGVKQGWVPKYFAKFSWGMKTF